MKDERHTKKKKPEGYIDLFADDDEEETPSVGSLFSDDDEEDEAEAPEEGEDAAEAEAPEEDDGAEDAHPDYGMPLPTD